jgi:hypothetical protein
LKGIKGLDFICLINREDNLEKVSKIVEELEENEKKKDL